MSVGSIISLISPKAKEPKTVIVSDGTISFPFGHPDYYTGSQPDGMLLLDLGKNEYSEFAVETDRDFEIKLYNQEPGSRFKLFVHRTQIESVFCSFNQEPHVQTIEGGTPNLVVLNVEVANIDGQTITKVVDNIYDEGVSVSRTWSSAKIDSEVKLLQTEKNTDINILYDYMDTQDAQVLSDANDYSDTGDNQTLADAKTYADTKEPVFAKKTAFNKDYGTVAGTTAEGNHNHDSRYYTESEIDTKLNVKSDSTHNHDTKYLGITAKATDSNLLDGVDGSYYAGRNSGVTSQDPNLATAQFILTNHTNSPSSSYYWHIRTQFYSTISSTGNRAQLAIQYNTSNAVYSRSSYNNVWTSWVRLDNNGKAADSSKLNGYAQADSTAAYTIALRNSSGDIQSRLFRSTYGEQTTAPATTADICFRNSTSDNYIRFMSNAAFSSWCQSAAIKTYNSDRVDGYHASITNNASYVAVRDSAKILYANDFSQSSDKRLKKNIKQLKKGINGLKPVSFKWRDKKAKGLQYGFIAQDMQQSHPELVSNDKSGMLTIKQNSIIALLVKEVQDLKAQIEKLS